MSKLVRVLLALLILALVGGAIFLITWDIPAPTGRIEKPIPNDRFK
jgi:hypothetical protein